MKRQKERLPVAKTISRQRQPRMQQQYFSQTHDGDKVKQKFVSDQAKQSGLYWNAQ